MIELTLSTGEPLALKPAPVRKLKGTRLPGCDLYRGERKDYAIIFQEFDERLFRINYCAIDTVADLTIQVREKIKGLRLVTLMTGEGKVRNESGKVFRVLAGQYFIAENYILQLECRGGSVSSYVSVYYAAAFLETIGVKVNLLQEKPVFLPGAMSGLIDEMLVNPYDQHLRAFYYDNAIGKLLLLHLAIPAPLAVGDLSDSEIAAIHAADRLMAENLHIHFTIRDLAKKANTNAFVLKKGFQQIFGVPVFQRLIQRRMERAKDLLEKTNRPIKDICELAGYQTVGGFITSFRKRFGVTPKDWRKQKQSGR